MRAPATAVARRYATLLYGGVPVLLAGVVYVNALHNPFVWDDVRTVANNQSLGDLHDIRAIVMHDVTRPLVNLSYAIDRALWGPEPFGFHIDSVLLHMLNVLLLFLLVRRLAEDRQGGDGRFGTLAWTRPDGVGASAASLFAVHPMMTEAVGYISGRAEVLCTTFFLLGFLCLRRWIENERGRWLALAVALWSAGLASKETALMFPLVLLCYHHFMLRGQPQDRRARLVRVYVRLIALTLAAGALRLAVLLWVENPGPAAIQWRHAFVELDVLRQYVVLMVLPAGQSIFHPVVAIRSAGSPRAIAAVAFFAVLVLAVWRTRRVDGLISFGLCWFLLSLVPAAVPVLLNLGEPMAEHRVYLASCGLFMAAGASIAWMAARAGASARRTRLLVPASLGLWLCAFGGLTMVRNGVWANARTLWLDAVEKAPDLWLPHVLLGEALHAAGMREQAAIAYRNALTLRPDYKDGYLKLGVCLAELKRLDEAAAAFGTLRRLDPTSAVGPAGLGTVAMLAGQWDEARRHFGEALAVDPRNVAARQSLAILNETVSANPAEALRLCEEIRKLAPETPGNDDCIRRNRTRVGDIAR